MKSLQQIKQQAGKADYKRVAEIVDMSVELVKKVVNGDRNDLHHIQKTFSDMLEARERLAQREHKRRERKRERQAA